MNVTEAKGELKNLIEDYSFGKKRVFLRVDYKNPILKLRFHSDLSKGYEVRKKIRLLKKVYQN